MNIPRTRAGLRVLLVTDDAPMADALRAGLGAAGCEVVARAPGGRAAVEAALRTSPEFILMDVRARDEFDGIRAMEMIQEFMELPVLYLTEPADHGTPRTAQAIHAAGYVRKPVEPAELPMAIEAAVHRFDRQRRLERRHLCEAALLANSAEGFVALTPQGEVEYLNSVAEGLTGWSFGEARGRPFVDILQFADAQRVPRRSHPLARVGASGTKVLLGPDDYVLGRHGILTPVEGTIEPVADQLARLVGIAVTLRSVSEMPRRHPAAAPGTRSLVAIQRSLIPRSRPDRVPHGTGAGKA